MLHVARHKNVYNTHVIKQYFNLLGSLFGVYNEGSHYFRKLEEEALHVQIRSAQVAFIDFDIQCRYNTGQLTFSTGAQWSS